MLGYLESFFCVVCVSAVQQSLTVFWREERSKIIETIIFEIPISITMEFAIIQVPPASNLSSYNGKNATGPQISKTRFYIRITLSQHSA